MPDRFEWASEDERLLFEWGWERGIDPASPMRPALCPESGCRGLIATRQIVEGEVVLRVPSELLMSTDTALRDLEIARMVEWAEAEGIEVEGKLVLAYHLILERERGEKSPWHRFICSLPEGYDTYENWTPCELSLLRLPDLIVNPLLADFSSSCQRGAELRRATFERQHHVCVRMAAAAGRKTPSRRDFAWAWGSVSTRSCTFEGGGERFRGEGAKSAGCLVPLLDLLNHSPHTGVAKCGLSEGPGPCCYEVRVGRGYMAGEEVLIHYGAWSNDELADYYGFAVRSNPCDACPIVVPVSEGRGGEGGGKRQRVRGEGGGDTPARAAEDKENEKVRDVVMGLGKCVGRGGDGQTRDIEVKIYTTGDEQEVPWSLMTLLRWDALQRVPEPGLSRLLEADEERPISEINERMALEKLCELVRACLETIRSIDCAGETASRGGGGDRGRLCALIRQGRREILERIDEVAEVKLKELLDEV